MISVVCRVRRRRLLMLPSPSCKINKLDICGGILQFLHHDVMVVVAYNTYTTHSLVVVAKVGLTTTLCLEAQVPPPMLRAGIAYTSVWAVLCDQARRSTSRQQAVA